MISDPPSPSSFVTLRRDERLRRGKLVKSEWSEERGTHTGNVIGDWRFVISRPSGNGSRSLGELLHSEHCPATLWDPTKTFAFSFELLGHGLVHFQRVIVKKFFARPQITEGVDENLLVRLFDCLAVWLARMIDPPRFIAANRRVDHVYPIIKAEKECVRVIKIIRNIIP